MHNKGARLTVETKQADILVIGAGGAGARAAVEAAKSGLQVVIACYQPLGRGGLTPTANGGYHAAVWEGDTPEVHARDLMSMGCYLNDANLVQVLTEESEERVRELEGFGAKVDWDIPPKPVEPQMSYPRSLFVPGKEILKALGRKIKELGNVMLWEDHLAVKLLKGEDGVCGAVFWDVKEGKLVVCKSKATILATGSLGEVYPFSAQEPMGLPTGSTGSGHLLAGWAGADLVDMEMIQFAILPAVPALIKGLRCLPWGAMKNVDGVEFLPPGLGPYSHEAAQLVWRQVLAGKEPITMDLRHLQPGVFKRNPLAAKRNQYLGKFRATPYQRPVEISLGVLYMMGGVHINERCETTLPRLYAAGEVAASVHGARRVSGNALNEITVFGARAGQYAAEAASRDRSLPEAPWSQVEEVVDYLNNLLEGKEKGIGTKEMRSRIRRLMGESAHVIRNGKDLTAAVMELESLEKQLPQLEIKETSQLRYNFNLVEGLEVKWLLNIAQVICRSALFREESRGFHFREDFPQEEKAWLLHTRVQWNSGQWSLSTKPVVK